MEAPIEIPIVDFSFIYQMSDNDSVYVFEVIELFLKNVPAGLAKLEDSVRNTDNFEIIQKQSHFLKSSANVIKVRGMFDDLVRMESLARAKTGKEEIVELLDKLLFLFNEALPVLEAEREKNKPKKLKAKS